MAERQFKIGLVGAGQIAREHALSLARDPRVQQMLVYDADPARSERFSQDFRTGLFDSLSDLIEECDIVWLCTPPAFHLDGVLRAAAAGKPVFCEKPLALTLRDCVAIRNAVKRARIPFFMGHSGRYGAPAMMMKQLASHGEIGEITSVWSNRFGYFDPKVHPAWRLEDERSGGVIVELGVHEIDFCRWIAGDWREVYATASNQTLNPGKYHDRVTSVGPFRGGRAAGTVSVSVCSPRYLWQRGVEGTTGSLFWDDVDFGHVQLLRFGQEAQVITLEPASWKDESTGENLTLRDQARAILTALQQGSPPPVSVDEGLAAMRVALATKESARSGKVVPIDQE